MKNKKPRYKIDKNKIINSRYFIPNFNKTEVSSIESKTFFDIEKYNKNIEHNNLFYADIKNTNDDYKENELIIPSWFYKKTDQLLRCRQIELIVTDYQKNILLKWFEISRIVYNITVAYLRKNKFIGFKTIRPIIKNKFNNHIKNLIIKYKVPVHVIDNSINDVIKAYNSNFANLKAGNITHFLIKYKNFYKETQNIVIEKEDFSKKYNGFYTESLKENNIFIPFKTKPDVKLTKKEIKCNIRLTYNLKTNKLILNIPTPIELVLNETKHKCFIDPGNKTFLSIYDPTGNCYKIFNRDNNLKLSKLIERKHKLHNKIYNNSANRNKKIKNVTKHQTKINNEINNTNNKLKLKKLRKQKNKLNKFLIKLNKKKYTDVIIPLQLFKKYEKSYKLISYRIQNLVKELHYKSADFLCKNFDLILLGKLNVKSITKKTNNMRAKEKRYSYAISHDKFRTVLGNKIEKYYCKELNIVDESYTSQTCGICGNNQDIGLNRVFKCNICLNTIDRDFNSARLIGIKNE